MSGKLHLCKVKYIAEKNIQAGWHYSKLAPINNNKLCDIFESSGSDSSILQLAIGLSVSTFKDSF